MLFRSSSRSQARQLVLHGHVQVNSRKTTIASYLVSKGDDIAIRQKSKGSLMIKANLEDVLGRGVPGWLELDSQNFKGQVLELPERDDLKIPIEESLIVELYSK